MKSEKQKMLSGEYYLASDVDLTSEREQTKVRLFYFNHLNPIDTEKGNKIIRELFGQTGSNFTIVQPFRCDYGYNITIGDNFFSNFNLTILDCAKVTIGNNVFIGPNVGLFTVNHPLEFWLRNKELEIAHPITLGDNVWIGGNVVVNPGVTIGDNSVIGAGSVVTKNIPDNVVAAGNPCRIIKQIDNSRSSL